MDTEKPDPTWPDSSEHPHLSPSEEAGDSEERPMEEPLHEEAAIEQFLYEDEPIEGENKEVIDVERYLENYKESDEDIREALSPQLNTTGLLLTLSLGGWYFVLKDSSGLPMHAIHWFLFLGFLTILLLIASLISGIEAINKRVTPRAISVIDELNYTVEVHKSKRLSFSISIWTLRMAFLLIIITIVEFWLACEDSNIPAP